MKSVHTGLTTGVLHLLLCEHDLLTFDNQKVSMLSRIYMVLSFKIHYCLKVWVSKKKYFYLVRMH